ncbi:MAG: protein translocase subunit SecF [Patescibacteria group bacterium]
MNIIKNRKFFYCISGALTFLAFVAFFLWGLKPGIDFIGGSLMEIEFIEDRANPESIQTAFRDAGIATVVVQGAGEKGYMLRFRNISEDEHHVLTAKLSGNSKNPDSVFMEKRFNTIGPAIGRELQTSSYKAIALVLVFILLYVAWAFRRVSEPVSSWKYGIVAIITLLHDISIPIGVFAYLGHFFGVEIDMLFISGILTILGFSVHDTIVVFDRIREKLLTEKDHGSFEDIVERSVKETIVRSINTSLTVIVALTAVFFFGGDTTRFMSLLLIIGMAVGVYSSIFIASPLLVSFERIKKRA